MITRAVRGEKVQVSGVSELPGLPLRASSWSCPLLRSWLRRRGEKELPLTASGTPTDKWSHACFVDEKRTSESRLFKVK